MKYLLIRPAKYSLGNYDMQEFATSEELTTHLLKNGLESNAIVAQRVALGIRLNEWPSGERSAEVVAAYAPDDF
jgi:hypothetical protein